MKPHPQQVYSVRSNYIFRTNLIIIKKSNGPIFQWGTWNGKKFIPHRCSNHAFFCNSEEFARTLLNKFQADCFK